MKFINIHWRNSNLDATNFSYSELHRCSFTNVTSATNATFEHATLKSTSIINSRFDNCNFTNADLTTTRIQGEGTTFNGGNFVSIICDNDSDISRFRTSIEDLEIQLIKNRKTYEEVAEILSRYQHQVDNLMRNAIEEIEDIKYLPMTEPYLNQERWNDGQ